MGTICPVYHAACEKSALPLAAGAEEGSSTWKCAECIRLEPKKAAVVKPAVVKPAVVKPAVVKPASSSSAQSTEPVDQAAERFIGWFKLCRVIVVF